MRAIISLLYFIPGELLFEHVYLPDKCLILLKFLKVLLVHLLVLHEHLLIMIVDLFLRLLVVLGLAAHQRNVIDEVLRDEGFSDTLKEWLDCLNVLKVVAMNWQL